MNDFIFWAIVLLACVAALMQMLAPWDRTPDDALSAEDDKAI